MVGGRLEPDITRSLDPADPVGTIEQVYRTVARGRVIGRAGIGLPGVLAPADGRLTRAQNLPALAACDVPAALSALLGVPLAFDNDVALSVVAERWRGCAQGIEDVAVLSLGTGVGAGIVSGGRLLRGAHGAAAEVADLPWLGDLDDAAVRAQGPLEWALGTAGLRRRYCALGGQLTSDSGAAPILAADDHAAVQVLEEFTDGVARVVLTLRAVLDPALVVLTGGIGAQPRIVEAVRTRLERVGVDAPRVAVAALGDRAPLVGAAALALGVVEPWVEVSASG